MMRVIFHTRMWRSGTCCAASLFLYAAGVYAQASTLPPSPPASYREVTDETGRTIRIPQTVRRVVSLAPSLTETVFALGLQDRLVGDTDFCDFPPAAKEKTKVGGAINPSLEVIASLHPDLVLVTKSLNRLDTVHALQELGIPSYATDPQTVNAIFSSIERLADILGAAETGSGLTKELQQHLAEIQKRVAPQPKVRVLFVVWMEPLISVGKDTFIADALRHAGAVSIVDASQNWPQVNLEEVVRLQPEFLVFAESHSQAAEHNFNALTNLPGWRILEAVRNKRYAVISDAVNRPAPRIIGAIEELARQLHPNAFGEKAEAGAATQDKPTAHSSSAISEAIPSFSGMGGWSSAPEECACAH